MRKLVRKYLFPPIDKKALERQIYELIHYGGFTYTEIMSMPISKRHRYFYLMVKYADRDNAVNNNKPAPPIDVEESQMIVEEGKEQQTVSDLVERAKKQLGKKKDLDSEEMQLPSAIREALNRMKEEGTVDERGALKYVEEPITESPILLPPKKKIEIPDTLKDLLANTVKVG